MSEPVSEMLFASSWTSSLFLDQKLAFFFTPEKFGLCGFLFFQLISLYSTNHHSGLYGLPVTSLYFSHCKIQNLQIIFLSLQHINSGPCHFLMDYPNYSMFPWFYIYRYIIYIHNSIGNCESQSPSSLSSFFQFLSFMICPTSPRYSRAWVERVVSLSSFLLFVTVAGLFDIYSSKTQKTR